MDRPEFRLRRAQIFFDISSIFRAPPPGPHFRQYFAAELRSRVSAKLLFTHTLPRSRQYRLYPYRYSPFPLPPLVRFSWVLGGRPVYYFGPRALTLGGGWGRPFALVLGVQGLCSAPCPVWGPGLSVSPDGLHGWGRYGATSFAP
eukprot:scaffold31116_cov34-Tisochrysis_lutea.AAC.3